jgi:hypothetical protein
MNTLLEPRELLEAIAIDLGIDPSGTSKPAAAARPSVRTWWRSGRRGGWSCSSSTRRRTSGLPRSRRSGCCRTSRPRSRSSCRSCWSASRSAQQLDLPRLEQLRQRITVSYHLNALDAGETESYINHRLRRASLGTPLQFPRTVTDRVIRAPGASRADQRHLRRDAGLTPTPRIAARSNMSSWRRLRRAGSHRGAAGDRHARTRPVHAGHGEGFWSRVKRLVVATD